MSDYDFNSTAHFDGGTKSETDTETDNPLVGTGVLGLSPTFTDRWAGGSRKSGWTEENDSSEDCVDETGALKIVARDNCYSHLQRSPGVDNITLQGKLKFPSGSSQFSWASGLVLYWDVDNWVRLQLVNDSGTVKYEWDLNDASTTSYGVSGSLSAGTWYWLKIVLTSSEFTCYYSTDGSSWATLKSSTSRPSGWSGNPMVIIGKGYSDNPTYSNADFDNSFATPGSSYNSYITDVVVTPYKTSGTWISSQLTMPTNKRLKNIKLDLTNGDASNYIDKIEVLKASDSSVLSTYATDQYTDVTLTKSDFDNGFGSTMNTNIKLKFYFVGDGTKTITLDQLYGDYELGPTGVRRDRFVNEGGI